MARDDSAALLHGFGVTGYRSLHAPEPIRLANLRKITLVAGPNNSGKSNILDAVRRFLPEVPVGDGGREHQPIDSHDRPQGENCNRNLLVEFGWNCDAPNQVGSEGGSLDHLNSAREAIRESSLYDSETGLAWLRFQCGEAPTSGNSRLVFDPLPLAEVQSKNNPFWSSLSTSLTQNGGGQPGEDVGRVLSRVLRDVHVPQVRSIGRLRSVSMPVSDDNELDGPGLIDRLQQFQNPAADYQQHRSRFETINMFIADVFESPDARIEVPHDKSTILVHADNRVLPLDSVGAGLHQLIIIAAAATVEQGTLLCIEEPETNMHPLLQRKLLRYLQEHTTNQYLIATHSAAMIDTEATSVHGVSLTGNSHGTRCERIAEPSAQALVAMQLGYRASDLVQSNAVIWLEGPSDRIYLRHWLRMYDPSLIEGYHYSIMFYGGALLNHLSADDPDVTDFISLSRINRNSAILIDSDKTTSRKQLNSTKKRVRAEFDREGVPGFAWITDGYTIENYVPDELLTPAIEAIHPTAKIQPASSDRYQNPLSASRTGVNAPDKVRIARAVVESWTNESLPDDLARKIRTCVAFVRSANQI